MCGARCACPTAAPLLTSLSRPLLWAGRPAQPPQILAHEWTLRQADFRRSPRMRQADFRHSPRISCCR
eukprot:11196322-Lingulodinium_polyedra.AAC.1